MTTLPHVHNETGECLACDCVLLAEALTRRGYVDSGPTAEAFVRVSTALATLQSALGGAEAQAKADMALIEQTKRECREALATSQARAAELVNSLASAEVGECMWQTACEKNEQRVVELEADREHLERAAQCYSEYLHILGAHKRAKDEDRWLDVERARKAKG